MVFGNHRFGLVSLGTDILGKFSFRSVLDLPEADRVHRVVVVAVVWALAVGSVHSDLVVVDYMHDYVSYLGLVVYSQYSAHYMVVYNHSGLAPVLSLAHHIGFYNHGWYLDYICYHFGRMICSAVYFQPVSTLILQAEYSVDLACRNYSAGLGDSGSNLVDFEWLVNLAVVAVAEAIADSGFDFANPAVLGYVSLVYTAVVVVHLWPTAGHEPTDSSVS